MNANANDLDTILTLEEIQAIVAKSSTGTVAPVSSANADDGLTMDVTRMDEVESERHVMAWEGYLPAYALSAISGDSGQGKSTFTLWLAAQITRGDLEGEYFGQPQKVVIYSPEDGLADTIKPRLEANGADMTKIFYFQPKQTYSDEDGKHTYPVPLALPEHMPLIRQAVQQYEPALFIIDPITDCIKGDPNSVKDVATSLVPLNTLAQEYGVSVLGINHTNKGSGTGGNRMAGSHKIKAITRALLMFTQIPDEPGHVLLDPVKSNGFKPGPNLKFKMESARVNLDDGSQQDFARINLVGKTEQTFDQQQAILAAQNGDISDHQVIEDHLYETLPNKGHENTLKNLTKELREILGNDGITESKVRRIAKDIGAYPVKESGKNGAWYWILDIDTIDP